MDAAASEILNRIASGTGGYVCFSNVHTVVTARSDQKLRDIINQSFMSAPDGRPLSMIARLRGLRDVGQVAGPDFLPYFLARSPGIRHYFFGSTPETLDRLASRLRQQFPEAIVAGSHSPPFRPLDARETQDTLSRIRDARPDVIWVGLGAPKQEYWMADHWQALRPAILLGVGAAFDIFAGNIPRAPWWMRALSLEWLYRLLREPRRLWKRYFVTNSLFLIYLLADAARSIPSHRASPSTTGVDRHDAQNNAQPRVSPHSRQRR